VVRSKGGRWREVHNDNNVLHETGLLLLFQIDGFGVAALELCSKRCIDGGIELHVHQYPNYIYIGHGISGKQSGTRTVFSPNTGVTPYPRVIRSKSYRVYVKPRKILKAINNALFV
jgi:hypothetical protein